MIWNNPWGWTGLVALAAPVLIHLLSRRRATVQPFPTLRFLDASRLTPTRRTRLNDLLLLAIRLGILTAAVVALAQPVFLTVDRAREVAGARARVIVVDTSASMTRLTPTGERAIDVARRQAGTLAAEVQASVILESSAMAGPISGAVAWLKTQKGTRELVLLSDFQIGALDRADLAAVPADIGVNVRRIEIRPVIAPIESRAQFGDVQTVAHVTLAADRTDVDWIADRSTSAYEDDGLVLLAGADERAAAEAARTAASRIAGVVHVDARRPVAVVYSHASQLDELLHDARALDQPWMADVVDRLRSDSTLIVAAATANVAAVASDTARCRACVVVARTDAGRPVALAAAGSVRDHNGLLVFSLTEAGSLTSAALAVAATRATSTTPPESELEPATVPDSVLQTWQRAAVAGAAGARDVADLSDGRWCWIGALVLLAIEMFIRRRSPASSDGGAMADESPHAE